MQLISPVTQQIGESKIALIVVGRALGFKSILGVETLSRKIGFQFLMFPFNVVASSEFRVFSSYWWFSDLRAYFECSSFSFFLFDTGSNEKPGVNMKKINIVYGTVNGEAEFVAKELATFLDGESLDNELIEHTDLLDWRPAIDELLLIVCSSTGYGDMPDEIFPWHVAIEQENPNWQGLEVGLIGLGDSSYEIFNGGIMHFEKLAEKLGATQIQPTLKLDATVNYAPESDSQEWLKVYLERS